jgi:tetratricopeptide (TPR) repeat protein/tRNA A-37 threonylcarbamoyl transferase component Bud32
MLQCAIGCETETTKRLEEVLDKIDVPDADWRIGNYQILEEIGRGGMGVIYRARQRHSRRIVALKRILSYQAESQETLVRFRREAEAAASLDHPNVLPIYEVSESEDGLPFFSMKFAVGGSLLDAARSLRNDPRRIVALIAKVTRAVQCAHVQGILHRDLKPGNILLDGRGEPLVSDFGLAKWLDTSSDLTRTLMIFGTPGYIAPEQAHGAAKNLTPAADIYSIGAVLFDLFTGRTPFLGEHALAVIKQAVDKPAPKLRTLAPLADRDVETICAKCLEREPQARYRSAGDLAEDLERWLEGRPIVARPVSPPVRIWRWSKRNPKLAGSIAACLVLGSAAGLFETQKRAAARANTMALHSIAVEPLFDLDKARPDPATGSEIAKVLQVELSKYGPVRIFPIRLDAKRNSTDPGREEDLRSSWKGARTALQGTKRARDGKVRMSLRLINSADGKAVYREIVTVDSAEREGEIAAKKTASGIHHVLSTANPTPAESMENDPGWQDRTTRELLVSGKAVMERRTVIDATRAIELFGKVLKLQPDSALAYSYLAVSHDAHGWFTGDSSDLSAAMAAAKAAIDLNPRIRETHKALSRALFSQGRFGESLDEAFTACELAQNDAELLASEVAGNLRMLGDPARAAAWYKLTGGSRPGANDFMVADCLVDLNKDEEAAALYRRVSTLYPEIPEGWMGLCRLALLQEDFAAARKISSDNWMRYRDFAFSEQMAAEVEFFSRNFMEAERLYKELAAKDPNGGSWFYGAVGYQSALGYLRLAAGDKDAGTAILETALAKVQNALHAAPQHPKQLYCIAAIESSLGRHSDAVAHLSEAISRGWIDYRSLNLDPRYDAVRDDERFQAIVNELAAKVARLKEQSAKSGL